MAGVDSDSLLLHRAAESGDVNQVRQLLKHGEYLVNCTDSIGKTPLHYACAKGRLDMVRMLIGEFGADVTIQDTRYGSTALMVAILSGHDSVTRALLEDYQCPVDSTDKVEQTVLHYACIMSNLDLIRVLIQQYKLDVNSRNSDHNSCLHMAASFACNKEVVLALIKEFGCDPNCIGHYGRSLLHYACDGGNIDLVRALIHDFGADMNSKDANNDSPIHLAALGGKYDLVIAIIKEFSYNIETKGSDGYSILHMVCHGCALSMPALMTLEHRISIVCDQKPPYSIPVRWLCGEQEEQTLRLIMQYGYMKAIAVLQSACSIADCEMVRTLIKEYNADANSRTDGDNTALHLAAYNGKVQLVLLLVKEFSCNVNCKGFTGRSVLHSACVNGNVELVRVLIQDCKADVTSKDDYGNTPLHLAAAAGNTEATLALINEFGCDAYSKGYQGSSALHWACVMGHVDTVKSLCNPVFPLIFNENGDTPLHCSIAKGNIDCVKALLDHNAPILIRNKAGRTPKDLARGDVKLVLEGCLKEDEVDYEIIRQLSKKRYPRSESLTRVFVVGNQGTGKSTLVESLKRQDILDSRESSVPPHTAGIVPSIHSTKHYGRVIFYDFSGNPEYYSSHAAILENLASTKNLMINNIFIIVVNLTDGSSNISNGLSFWVSFIQSLAFDQNKPNIIALGSHLDIVESSHRSDILQALSANIMNAGIFEHVKSFMMDCRQPISNDINAVVNHICDLTKGSPQCSLSIEASILLGLLERDFSNVTACYTHTIVSHIKEAGIQLRTDKNFLHSILSELHELGLLFLIQGDQNNTQVILDVSQLTQDVHRLLFSEEAKELQRNMHGNIGIVPESYLTRSLPEHITTSCLVQLKYCQVISYRDVSIFSHVTQWESANESFLFFPALCSAERADEEWTSPHDFSHSMGWMAQCTNPWDHFPSRFLHVLLLRLVFRFVLSSPTNKAWGSSSLHRRRCTVWKTGVQWLAEEGLQCSVELIAESRIVVVSIKCIAKDAEASLGDIAEKLLDCVMEVKTEFCHSITPSYFLLGSTDEASYLDPNNLFAVQEVERALSSSHEVSSVIVSVGGRGVMKCCDVLWMKKLILWHSLFPMTFPVVLEHIQSIVRETYHLGLQLLPRDVVESIGHKFPADPLKQKKEAIKEWFDSSVEPPCWWHLVRALREIEKGAIADCIEETYGTHIKLQKKLLARDQHPLPPDTEFLESFAGVVGCKWPSLAASLGLGDSEVREVRQTQLPPPDQALLMLNKWVSRGEATYGQLYQKLNRISLFQ